MVRIAIVEDDNHCAQDILKYLERYQQENQIQIETTRFENGLVFIDYDGPCFDIVFMDIRMPIMNGMEAARKLRMAGNDCPLIFLTSMAQYALEGYQVDAMDFMVKPVGYFNFSLKLRKALQRLDARQMNVAKLKIQTKDGFCLVNIASLCFVEVQQHDLILCSTGESLTIRSSLKSMEERLSPYGFARCSNSYLVNLNHVTGISKGEVLLKHNAAGIQSLKMSRRCKAGFETALTSYLRGDNGNEYCADVI